MIENAPFENLFEIFDADARNNIIETMFRDRINLIEQYSRQEINSFQVSKILGIKGRIIASSNYIETCDQKKTEFQAGIKELSEEIKELTADMPDTEPIDAFTDDETEEDILQRAIDMI